VVQAAVGNPISVTLTAQNAADLFSVAPIRLKYDPKVLRLTDIIPGDLLSHDGQRVTTAKDIRTFVFTAVGKGNGAVMMTEFNLRNAQNAPVTIAPAPLQVTVQ
jgi:hypothetical protein